jgi:hypothetical protein
VFAIVAVVAAGCGGAGVSAAGGSAARREAVMVVVTGGDVAEADVEPGVPGVRVRAPARAEPSAAERAQPALDRARALYRDLAFEESLAAVGEAQVVLERAPTTPEDFAALHTALVYRAMNELALGSQAAPDPSASGGSATAGDRSARARDSLRLAAAMAPQTTLDEGLYPPDVRALHEELRASVRAEPPVGVAVTTEPPGATVAVDGRDAGHTPATVHGPPGRHHLRLAAPGFEPRVVPLVFGADTAPQSIELRPADVSQATADVAARDAADLAALPADHRTALARALDAPLLLRVVPRDPTGWSGTLVDLRSGAARPLDFEGPDARDAVADMLERAAPELGETAGDTDETTVVESPWLWAGVALVAAAVAVTAYILLTSPTHEVVLQ